MPRLAASRRRWRRAQALLRHRRGETRLDIGNGRVEAINNKAKVTARMGYGFKNVDNLLVPLMLRCGGCMPAKERKHSKRRTSER